jgi:hypothetical protein
MLEYNSAIPAGEQDANSDHLFYDYRFEEPPFVYLGCNYPPELATDLPGHIYSFEQAWKEAKPVRVYELLGSPEFRNEKEIDDASLKNVLAGVIGLMEQNNIHVDTTADQDDREIYRYITDIVFEQEVDDLKLGGLGRHFFYRQDFT